MLYGDLGYLDGGCIWRELRTHSVRKIVEVGEVGVQLQRGRLRLVI